MGPEKQERGYMDQLIGQKGIWVSEEYAVAYKDSGLGWIMITASMVTTRNVMRKGR